MNLRSRLIGLLLTTVLPGVIAQSPSDTTAPAGSPAPVSAEKAYTIPAGTRILLSLKHEVSSRTSQSGDPVYLVCEFPVVQDGAVVIPAGMYVRGVIDRIQRPGKVKGRAELQMHLNSMIFPNGVEINLNGALDNVPGSPGAKVKGAEGTVEQAGSKGRDARTIANDTGEGAAVGGLVGSVASDAGKGVGIGAGAGAAVGVLTTLLTRGNDISFPQGTTLEWSLTRTLVIQQSQLAGMSSYTGLNLPATPK